MRLVVCVKQVPDTTQVRIDPETNTLIREGIPSIVNPYDIHAIEEGVRLKESFGGRVTVLTMGPPQAKEALREAIAIGADDAVLLSDRAFAGSDTWATSLILAEAIKRMDREEAVDLIICGKQSIDGDTAQVGPGIAQRLDFTQLTYVVKVRELDKVGGRIIVERQLEDGRQIVEGRMPALMTVVKEINEARYAPLANIIKAAKYEPSVWNQETLQLEREDIGLRGSPTTVRRIFAPPPRPGGELLGDDGDTRMAVQELIEKLKDREIL